MLTKYLPTLHRLTPIVFALIVLEILGILLSDNLNVWDRIDLLEDGYLNGDLSGWLLTGVVVLFIVGLIWRGQHRWARRVVIGYMLLFTFDLILSAALMILSLAAYKQGAEADALLWDGMVVWLTNVMLFALWYWLLDAGGPLVRGTPEANRPDFLFPLQANAPAGWADWQPNFVDYLFLAFTVNTAYSPTDTLFLSRRVKGLLMIQSIISLLTFATVVARAVNIIS
jgi:uncharacterized membrane protein